MQNNEFSETELRKTEVLNFHSYEKAMWTLRLVIIQNNSKYLYWETWQEKSSPIILQHLEFAYAHIDI